MSILENINWKAPKSIIALLLLALIITTGIGVSKTATYAVSISVNGEQLGYVSGMNQAKKMVEEILLKQGQELGVIPQTSDDIKYERKWLSKEEYNSQMVSEAQLTSAIKPFVEGYGLNVNGKMIAVLPAEEDIGILMTKYKEYQTKPSETNKVESADFVEEISISAIRTSLKEIKTLDEAFQMLVEGNVILSDYTVQQDDSLWTIARKNNMYTKEILAANPEITEESILQLGQVLKLSRTAPYLTVISKGRKVEKETIPFSVETKADNSLAAGKSIIKQAGQDGEKEVAYSYVEENGKLINKEVVQEEVISEPVKQVIAQGPDRRAVMVSYSASRGSGSISGLKWPLSGRINSYYGYRGGEFHTGIDIGGDSGQPYAAAAAGKVIGAGWNGNYGKMITIDHGNGVVTRYAHSSQLLVSAGQTVSQGQTIGYVGNTGRSSGPHLHFEIISNGNTVNPLNYL